MMTAARKLMMAGAPADASEVYTDDFNRANENMNGNGWDIESNDTSVKVVSNQAEFTGTSTMVAAFATAVSSTNMYVEADVIDHGDPATPIPAICVRLADADQTTYGDLYMARWNTSTSEWRIFSRVSGSYTAIKTVSGSAPTEPYRLRLEADGSTITLYEVISGTPTQRAQVTDTDVTTGTRGGLYGRDNAGFEATFDNFEVGTL